MFLLEKDSAKVLISNVQQICPFKYFRYVSLLRQDDLSEFVIHPIVIEM